MATQNRRGKKEKVRGYLRGRGRAYIDIANKVIRPRVATKVIRRAILS